MKNSEDDDRDRSRDKHRKVFYHCFDPYREENVERDGRDRIKKHLEGSDKSFSMNNMSVMGDKEENNDIEYRPNNK